LRTARTQQQATTALTLTARFADRSTTVGTRRVAEALQGDRLTGLEALAQLKDEAPRRDVRRDSRALLTRFAPKG
jgi:hypothetical protein